MVEKQSLFGTLKGKVAALSATTGAMVMAAAFPAAADDAKAAEALKNAGISTTESINGSTGDSLMGSATSLVYVIMGLGALWAVAWVVIGGMLLAGSGSNPQKRSGGLAAIAVACVGIYVIYKAFTIAGWAAAL